ncbi:MAG TPA: PepSY-associated TM helix domain-containing protein [Flavisolibacter sp.]
MKATKHIFRWHHWCGLIAGIFLLMMSLSGSILVFSEEMEGVEEQSYPKVAPIPGVPSFDVSFSRVRSLYPGWEIRLYHLPEKDKALVYELRKNEQRKKVFVHPVSGDIIGSNENANQTLQRQLLLYHYTLFSGTKGKVVVFLIGILFLVTLITGLIVYRRSILKTISFKQKLNRRSARALYSSLHRIVGVWSVIFNLLIVATGLWLSGQIAWTALNAASTPGQSAASMTVASIDDIIQKIRTARPDYEIHLVRIRPGSNKVGVSGRLKSDPSYYGNYYSVFVVDGQSSEILSSSFLKDQAVGGKLSKMAGPLHFGNYGGPLLKILYCILGLTPGLLSITGFILWTRKRKK